MFYPYTGNGNLPDDWDEEAFERYWGYEDGESDEEEWEDDDDICALQC